MSGKEFERSMTVMPDVPSESEEKSQLIGLVAVSIIFSQNLIGLEVANNSSTATIYVDISGAVATLAKGIPIYPKAYYSVDRKILQPLGISIISDTPNTDVRIIGHFNLQSEIAF